MLSISKYLADIEVSTYPIKSDLDRQLIEGETGGNHAAHLDWFFTLIATYLINNQSTKYSINTLNKT